jgi:hypothetical protein
VRQRAWRVGGFFGALEVDGEEDSRRPSALGFDRPDLGRRGTGNFYPHKAVRWGGGSGKGEEDAFERRTRREGWQNANARGHQDLTCCDRGDRAEMGCRRGVVGNEVALRPAIGNVTRIPVRRLHEQRIGAVRLRTDVGVID